MNGLRIDVRLDGKAWQDGLAADVRRGLTSWPRFLPPKYFYDATGSALFEEITRLPEYYLTRAEDAVLRSLAPALMGRLAPAEIVEIGAGAGTKIRRFLDGADGLPALRYVPVDVDRGTVESASAALLATYPFLRVHAVVGDFERHLGHVPPAAGRRLVAFLGSTIGNLDPPERAAFLRQARTLLEPGDRFLLGVDLVKDTRVLEAAYNDARGVTAEFNRNVLRVVNRGLDADFEPARFRHHAWFNTAASRIEMHLVPDSPLTVHVRALGLTVEIGRDESIWTESSYKFTRASADAMLAEAGLAREAWHTDPGERFALVLAAPA